MLQTALSEILSYYPAGASVQLLVHYYQTFVTSEYVWLSHELQDLLEKSMPRRQIESDLFNVTLYIS